MNFPEYYMLRKSADVLVEDREEVSKHDRADASKAEALFFGGGHPLVVERAYSLAQEISVKEWRNALRLFLLKQGWIPFTPTSVQLFKRETAARDMPWIMRMTSPRVFRWSLVVLMVVNLVVAMQILHPMHETMQVPIVQAGPLMLMNVFGAFLFIFWGRAVDRNYEFPDWAYQRLEEFSEYPLPDDARQRMMEVKKCFPQAEFCIHVLWKEREACGQFPLFAVHLPSYGKWLEIYYLEAWDEPVTFERSSRWIGLLREGLHTCA